MNFNPSKVNEEVSIVKSKPTTEDKYWQAVEENELQKLYDEWQKTHDRKVYLEKCFGSKIIHNSLNSDNFGTNQLYKAYSKQPKLRNPENQSIIKTISNPEESYSPNKKSIVQYAAGGGANYDLLKDTVLAGNEVTKNQ